jgi:hypothetical protein
MGQHPAQRQSQLPISFSPHLYRNAQFFKRIKQYRHLATHYDKLAVNYFSFVQLASIRPWLRVNEPRPG